MSKSQIRANFRKVCLKRDGHSCVTCGISEEEAGHLDVHHITDRNEIPNGGYVLENGISLCNECHLKAERYHISGGWQWEEGYHPNTLYYLIGSSPEKAVEASENLK